MNLDLTDPQLEIFYKFQKLFLDNNINFEDNCVFDGHEIIISLFDLLDSDISVYILSTGIINLIDWIRPPELQEIEFKYIESLVKLKVFT